MCNVLHIISAFLIPTASLNASHSLDLAILLGRNASRSQLAGMLVLLAEVLATDSQVVSAPGLEHHVLSSPTLPQLTPLAMPIAL